MNDELKRSLKLMWSGKNKRKKCALTKGLLWNWVLYFGVSFFFGILINIIGRVFGVANAERLTDDILLFYGVIYLFVQVTKYVWSFTILSTLASVGFLIEVVNKKIWQKETMAERMKQLFYNDSIPLWLAVLLFVVLFVVGTVLGYLMLQREYKKRVCVEPINPGFTQNGGAYEG